MKTSQSNQYGSSYDEDTVEKDSPVSLKIKSIRDQDCDKLQSLIGELTQLEENRKGSKQVFETKKCCVIHTEYNYQIYRNLELCVGTELTQATLEIKQDITNYIALSDAVAAALKNVVKVSKDAFQKFKDFRQAAFDLGNCKREKCNCSQVLILTGQSECESDEHKRPVKPACPGSEEILAKLISEPHHFFKDSEMIFNSAADITGIQTFTNIKSLDVLHQTLTTNITEFTGLVTNKKTSNATDLGNCQTELIAAITELTKTEYALYNKRDETDAEHETIEFLCKDDCDCKGRMKECKEEICDICKEMDDIYCERHKPDQQKRTVEM